MLDSSHIAASTLTKKNMPSVEISRRDQYSKAPGINCYSFATGRAPFSVGDDPVPGSYFLQQIRIQIISLIQPDLPPPRDKTSDKVLNDRGFNFDALVSLCESQPDLSKNLNRFVSSFFGKGFDSLEAPEQTQLLQFLTGPFQVHEKYLNIEVTCRLLELDGLIHVLPVDGVVDTSNFGFGTILLAAFVNPKDDYHFMRYFKDGWYERVGEEIRKRPHVSESQIFWIRNQEEMLQAFSSKDNGNDLEGFDFVGYYLVPTTVVLADRIGRKYILESHKT